MILALCKVQTVTFSKLSTAFETKGKASAESSLRRIQRFVASYVLNLDLMAKTIMKLIPIKGPYQLAIDRTNWDFGKFKINILALGIVYDGCAFPILFTLLPKKGNSNTEERKALLNRLSKLFGKNSIGSILADREFVGQDWINFLDQKEINYFIRIRENFRVHFPDGREVAAKRLFQNLKVGEIAKRSQPVKVNGVICYLTASRVKERDGKTEVQLIISYKQNEYPIKTYKNRWQIETMFKALKTSGFNLEDTHLNQKERLAKFWLL